MLIIDGMHYAKELDSMPSLADPRSALVYAVHPFFGSHPTADDVSKHWDTYFGVPSKTYPVLVTAWNTSNGACELYYPTLAQSLLQYLSSKQIGIIGVNFDVLFDDRKRFQWHSNYFDIAWKCAGKGKTTNGTRPRSPAVSGVPLSERRFDGQMRGNPSDPNTHTQVRARNALPKAHLI